MPSMLWYWTKETRMVSVDHMREKLSQWHPEWNVARFTDEQITAIYSKETIAMTKQILKMYSDSPTFE